MACGVALAAHDEVMWSAIEAHSGWLFKHTGDGVCAAFASPKAAVDAAVAGTAGPAVAGADGVGDRGGRLTWGGLFRRGAEPCRTGNGGRAWRSDPSGRFDRRSAQPESTYLTSGRGGYGTYQRRWACFRCGHRA